MQVTFLVQRNSRLLRSSLRPFRGLLRKLGYQDITYLNFENLEDLKTFKSRLFSNGLVILSVKNHVDLRDLVAVLKSTEWFGTVGVLLLTSRDQQSKINERRRPIELPANVIVTVRENVPLTSALTALSYLRLTGQRRRPDAERIVRSIEFPPEYHQSGITILSYFATILRQRNLTENVTVAIEQNDLIVRLIIESPTGKREEIERTLEAYALVVTGKSDIEALLSDPYQAMELKSQLRIAYVQLQNQRDLLELSKDEIKNLRTSLAETNEALGIAQRQRSAEAERFMLLLTGLTVQNSELSHGLQKVAEQAITVNNLALLDAVEGVKKLFERGLNESDREEFIQKVQIIKQEVPSLFDQISDLLLKSAISGPMGNAVYDWLRIIIGSIPK